MAAFRILNQAPQYLLADGRVNAGGKLTFYETDLTTPKNTWSDEAMTVLNSNPVVMDAAGRTLTDVWGDGEYGVVMSDADDVVIWTRNNVEAAGDGGLSLPTLGEGQFWSSDGSNILAVDIIQVPDPAGHADDILYSDGALAYWAAAPEPAEPEITVSTTAFQAGNSDDATKYYQQVGSDSAPASGTVTTSKSVTFPVAFSAPPFVAITITSNSQPGGPVVHFLSSAPSATGFTVIMDIAEGSVSGANIVNAVPFMWQATGTLEVP